MDGAGRFIERGAGGGGAGHPALRALAALALALTPTAVARAQYGAEAIVEAPLPAGSDADPTAAATVVDATDGPALGSTEELLRAVPGARVQSLGAVGSFAGLSIRGASLEHTAVLLGDVPLTGADGSAFDLSTLPPWLLSTVEVYRGGAPLSLGVTAPGGVVRLVPREESATRAEATLGVGSFARVEGRAAAAVAPAVGPSLTAVAGGRHADNGYPYLDDRGTPLVREDDVTRHRQNADTDEGHGLIHLHSGGVPGPGGEVEALLAAFARTGGLTGSPVEEPTHVRRGELRGIGALGYTLGDESAARPWRVRALLSGDGRRERVADRFRELSRLRRFSDDRTMGARLRLDGEVALTEALGLTALVAHAWTRRDPGDRTATQGPGASTRHTVDAGLELQLNGHLGRARAQARLSGGLIGSRSRLIEVRAERRGEHADVGHVIPTGRLGLVVEPVRGLGISAGVATEAREPSFVELFGDGALLLGDTRLREERSVSIDTGAVMRGRLGPLRGAAELRGFVLLIDDLIRYVRTSQLELVPQNVGRATVGGVELGVRGQAGRHVGLTGALTVMRAVDRDLRRDLPLRPRITAYVGPEIRLGPWGRIDALVLHADVTHVGRNAADPHGLVRLDARTLVGAGLAMEIAGHVRVDLTVRDLLDERPFDLVGYPLPGRSVALELTVQTGERW